MTVSTETSIGALSADQARALCTDLIAKRAALNTNIGTLKSKVHQHSELSKRAMPILGALLAGVSEQAGLRSNPQVCAMITAIGDGTYPQWSKGLPMPAALATDAPSTPAAPGATDAQMILSAALLPAAQRLDGTARTILCKRRMETDSERLGLANLVQRTLYDAARDALATTDTPLTLPVREALFGWDGRDVVQALTRAQAVDTLRAVLAAYARDVTIARQRLKGDLRMAVLRESARSVHVAWMLIERIRELTPSTQEPDDHPF